LHHVGFNYDVNGKKSTQIRGLGVFTSRLPLVWPGGTYNNNGVSQGAIFINASVIRCNSCNDAVFNPNPSVASQIAPPPFPRPGSGRRVGDINLFSKDFQLRIQS
jgi:hypothetical protein